MNVKLLNPFVEAAHEVFLAEVGVTVARGNLSLHKSALTTDEITVMISMVGQVQGVVLYGLPTATGLALVSHMLGEPCVEFDSLAQSGVAELGNVITGRACVKLSAAGYWCNLSPPALIFGKNITISTLDFSRIVVPLVLPQGEVLLHLALRENPNALAGFAAAAQGRAPR